MISHYTSAIGKVQGQQTCRFSRLQVRSDFTRTPCTGCASIEAFGPRKWADSLTTYCGVRLNTLDSLKATLGSDRERLPATWTVEGRWERFKLCGPSCQIDVRIQMCRVLDCRRWKENGRALNQLTAGSAQLRERIFRCILIITHVSSLPLPQISLRSRNPSNGPSSTSGLR